MPAQESAADLLITNVRHKQLVDGALASLWQARGTFEKASRLNDGALFA